MIAGKVTGSIVSTRKCDSLVGNKLLVVEVLNDMNVSQKQIIAIDKVGAGVGEYVLVALGSAARVGLSIPEAPVDAAVVGIIDDGSEYIGE
ncbi:MAG: EutN/CcmL family microcompartment protein [Lachnospiraceae bacterium]|nr:EutN/CcmL family microcompartment protein [Lachnospiraceae bacterium]